MFVYSVQIISRLDNRQSKFQMFTPFRSRHIGVPTWRLHTGLYKFVHNVSTNIWSLEERMDLKLGEVTSFIIFYSIAISWLHPPNGFQFNFLLRDSEIQELIIASISFTGPQKLFLSGLIISEGDNSQKPNIEKVFAENASVSIRNKFVCDVLLLLIFVNSVTCFSNSLLLKVNHH